jgi:hypothetical protein
MKKISLLLLSLLFAPMLTISSDALGENNSKSVWETILSKEQAKDKLSTQ